MPTIALMIGMPSPLAHERDEDNLDREHGNNQKHNNNGDVAAGVITAICHELEQRGPGAVRDVRAFANALHDMAHFALHPNSTGDFEEAADKACDELRRLIED